MTRRVLILTVLALCCLLEKIDGQDCVDGELQLDEGESANVGRVEFCVNGEWQIFCYDNIDPDVATVMCRQLGYDPIEGLRPQIINSIRFNFFSVFLRELTPYEFDLQCSGDESHLTDCPKEPGQLCSDMTEIGVGIRCPLNESERGQECAFGDIRLEDGLISEGFGRVEVCFNGEWGVVCNHEFEDVDAAVACRQLGFDSGAVAPIMFGRSAGRISVLDDLACDGSEERLMDCPHPGATVENCRTPFADASVICRTSVKRCPQGGINTTVIPENTGITLEGYGTCEPYEAASSLCNVIIPSSSYIFILPMTTQTEIADQLQTIGLLLKQSTEQTVDDGQDCQELVLKVLCNYFFPSCGSTAGVHRPVSVCSEECSYVASVCPETWSSAQDGLGLPGITLNAINCTDTEQRLNGLSDCCSGANVSLPDPPTTSASLPATTTVTSSPSSPTPTASDSITSLIAPLAGGIIAAIVILAIILVVVVVCFCFSTVKRRNIVREIQMEVLTHPTIRVANSSSPQELSPTKATSMSPSISPKLMKMRNNSQRVITNPYSTVFPAGKELDFSAPLLNPDSSKSENRISSSVIRDLSTEMVIPYCWLNLLDCIGQGEFGVVYKAEYTIPTEDETYEVTTVAVKTLKGFFDKDKVDSLMDESLKMKHFDHPNVLGLIGVCLDAGPAPYMVMPFMANGSLLHYLKKERSNIVLPPEVDEDVKIDIRKRLTIMCLQIANGMDYLSEEKFIHRDLAARNCMINLHFIIKISDFGLSEDIYSQNYFRQAQADNSVKLPVKWMAPESLSDGIFSTKTDVWSYGVTCWEVFSGGKTPYPGVDPLSLTQMLEKDQRLKKPTNSACSTEIYDMMRTCWAASPTKRPSFSEIARTLSGYTENLAGYLDMNFNPFTSDQQQQQQQKPQLENGFSNDILTRPDQLAALYDDLPSRKNRSPRSSPRASPRASPLPSPVVDNDSHALSNIKIQIEPASPSKSPVNSKF